MEDVSWVDKLQAGDYVIRSNRYGQEVYKVSRTTPKQIKIAMNSLGYEESFWKATCRKVGEDSWSYAYIKQATPEAVKVIEDGKRLQELLQELRNWIKDAKFPLEDLEYFHKYALEKKNEN